MAVSPKGERLAVSGGSLSLLETATGKQIHEVGNERRRGVLCALAFAPDGKVLVTGTDERRAGFAAAFLATFADFLDVLPAIVFTPGPFSPSRPPLPEVPVVEGTTAFGENPPR
jgi:hypothetical protein